MLGATDLVLVSPQPGGHHAGGRPLDHVRSGAEDYLYPLLPGAVRAIRRGPAAVPEVPGPTDRSPPRTVPTRDPAGLPHEGPLHLPQDRLETPADRSSQRPELSGATLVLDALPDRTHRGRAGPPFLRKFAVPDWALTEVFGRNPMYWHRLERSLGRFSLVGTTVKDPERLPPHLVADEKHTTLAGKKVYLAATAGGGCCLGMALAEAADGDDLTKAYGVFRQEVHHLDPEYRPETVNTDGWPATQAAWRTLFRGVTLILRFLHAFLRVRERAKHLKETFDVLRERIWSAYHAPDARTFSQRLRRLREWAPKHLDKLIVRETVLSLCEKRGAFVQAYAHPGCHRTSNPVDRLLRRLDYHLYCAQHLQGTPEAAEQGLRGWALIHNFAPSCPETVRETPGLRS